MAEIVIQDCGCVAIPEQIAASLGMSPGTRLHVEVDVLSRSMTLTAPTDAKSGPVPVLAACPIK